MPIFPYYNPYRRPFYNNYRPNYGTNYTPNCAIPKPAPAPIPHFEEHSSPVHKQVSNQEENRFHSKNNEDVWLDIFGIKLYFDDVLILSLLFFLYEEEVKDEGLFLALVMLLIS